VGIFGCPLGGHRGMLFHDRAEVEAAERIDAPSGGNGFAF